MSRRLITLIAAGLVVAVALGIALGIQRCVGDTDYLEVDPETGLHITGTPTEVDIDTYRLKVSGKVDHELSLSYDDIRQLAKGHRVPRPGVPRLLRRQGHLVGHGFQEHPRHGRSAGGCRLGEDEVGRRLHHKGGA